MEQGTSDPRRSVVMQFVKLCECNCGNPTPIAKRTVTARGYVKGQPMRFAAAGHFFRSRGARNATPATRAQFVKLCECGCGQPTRIARATIREKGYVKGQPMRFKSGHRAKYGGPRVQGRSLFVEVGQRIGRSVVVETEAPLTDSNGKAVRAARLRCDCGTEYVRLIKYILGRSNPSSEYCGVCNKGPDLTGQRFGGLTAIRWIERKPDRRRRPGGKWLCRCDCGSELAIASSELITYRRSCGCAHVGPRMGKGEAAVNAALAQYQDGARGRGLSWSLTREEFRQLTSLDCHYCGASPSMVKKGSSPACGDYVFNGLDRVDNGLGYEIGNVVPACKACNHAKVDMSYEDFMAWIARLASFHFFRPDLTPVSLLKPPA